MTTAPHQPSPVYSRQRWEIMHAVALGDPHIGVTAPPVIDVLIRERLIRCDGLDYVFTDAGAAVYARWAREHALDGLPGVTVRRSRNPRRCSRAAEYLGYTVTVVIPGQLEQTRKVTGTGAEGYIEKIRRENPGADVTVVGARNPHYDPGCPGLIPAGEAYADYQPPEGPALKLCVRCALAASASAAGTDPDRGD